MLIVLRNIVSRACYDYNVLNMKMNCHWIYGHVGGLHQMSSFGREHVYSPISCGQSWL